LIEEQVHVDHVVPVSAEKTHWLRMQSWDATGVSFWDDNHVTVPRKTGGMVRPGGERAAAQDALRSALAVDLSGLGLRA
jgi:hypothetical protein